MGKIKLGAVIAGFALVLSLGGAANAAGQAPRKDPKQFARGAKAWATQCVRCHNLRSPKEMTDKDWSIVMSHMRLRAGLPGQMTRDIEAFLRASN
ncbi:MAG: cytochrome c [Rhodospirillales bacterium]|nr:cytochrome c [Rhodospirillales bacterium]